MPLSHHLDGLAGYLRQTHLLYCFAVDESGVILWANPVFQQFSLMGSNGQSNHRASDLFENENEFASILNQAMTQPGHSFGTRLKLKSRGKVIVDLPWEFCSIVNENGEFRFVQVIGRVWGPEENVEYENFLRDIFSMSLDGMVMVNESGVIHHCASSTTSILGYEPDELLGKYVFEFVHSQDLSIAQTAFQNEVFKKSEVSYILIRLKHRDGRWIWCSARAHNLIGTPHVNALVIYFTDDSKRKDAEDRLKEREKHFRELIYNLNQGVALVNPEGKLIEMNLAARKLLALENVSMEHLSVYSPIWKLVNEDGSPMPLAEYPSVIAIRTLKSVHSRNLIFEKQASGERIWLHVNADPTFDNDGKLQYVVISFADITEQRKLSRQLLEQELQNQKQLIQATIDVQERERMEIGKELHDNINQHLTTTRLYLEVALDKAEGSVLEMIQLSHKTLASIIHEIRRISQDLVPPTMGEIGLVESVQDLRDSLDRAHTFNIDFYSRHFNEECLPPNMKLMLFRIIQEQISNIIRHSQATEVQIRLQSDAENIILTLIDNGKGFDKTNYKKGLGLNNIHNRISLFNGKMDINAAPGMGCTLTVTIPFKP